MDNTTGLRSLEKNTFNPSITNPVGIATTVPSHVYSYNWASIHQRTIIHKWSRVDKFQFVQDNNNSDSVHQNYIYILFSSDVLHTKKKLVIP